MRQFLALAAAAVLAVIGGSVMSPAPAQAQQDEESLAFGMCSGQGCCVKGGTKPGDTCVKTPRLTVRTADGQGLTKVRMVQKSPRNDDDNYLWGLADLDGRILIPPKYDFLSPVSPKVAWARRVDGNSVIIVDGKERPTPVKEVDFFKAVDGPPYVFGILGRHKVYKMRDLAVLDIDGTFGPTLKRVLPDDSGIAQLEKASVLVVGMENENGERGSAFLDGAGRVFWAGPETVAHSPGWGSQSACQAKPTDPGYPGRAVSLVLGPSPLNLGDPRLFRPLDAKGAPVPLPPGVIGLTPLSRGGYCVSGWAIVSKAGDRLQYQLGFGSPAMVLADRPNLMPLDDVRKDEPTNFGDRREYADGAMDLVVGKAAGQPAWYVTNEYSPRLVPGQQAWGTSSVAAADAFIGEIWAKVKIASAQRADREAQAQAKWSREQAHFDQNIARAKSLDTTQRLRLRSIALKDGGDRARRYWIIAADRRSDADVFCSHVPDACTAVVEKREADMASLLAYQARRGAIDAAFAAAARGNPNPDVKVTIYEGGRVRTDVMPQSHYENIYAPKR